MRTISTVSAGAFWNEPAVAVGDSKVRMG